jgi:hypothetical protein
MYSGGDGTTTLTFSYTVATDVFEPQGLASSVTAIDSNGGATILDAGGNAPTTTFASQDLSDVYIALPYTKLWVDENFINQAPSGGATVNAGGGALSSEGCGGGSCRTFDGDDSLVLTDNLDNVETLFLVIKTPAMLTGDHNMFNSTVVLKEDAVAGAYDLETADATVLVNGSATGGTIFHDLDLASSSVLVIQIDFTTPQSYSMATLIPSSFNGAVAEVVAISGSLNGPQKALIRNYLTNKY